MFTMIKLMREANKTIQEGLIGNPPIKVESIGGQNGAVSK